MGKNCYYLQPQVRGHGLEKNGKHQSGEYYAKSYCRLSPWEEVPKLKKRGKKGGKGNHPEWHHEKTFHSPIERGTEARSIPEGLGRCGSG